MLINRVVYTEGGFNLKKFNKTILVVSFGLLASIITLNLIMVIRFTTFSNNQIDDMLKSNISNLNHYMDRCIYYSANAAVLMAKNPCAVNAIREKDTEEALRIFTLALESHYVNYFAVTDYKGNVIARTHEPEKYGDSIADQLNVVNALNGEVSSFYEPGVYV